MLRGELRYGHVESALMEVLEIEPTDTKPFRARLRHLRNIGVPELPKTGSGQPISYSKRHALEMLVAVQLERIGLAPRSIAIFAASIVRQSPPGQHAGQDQYVLISPDVGERRGYTMVNADNMLTEVRRQALISFAVLNISQMVKHLDAALERTR